MDSLVPYIPWLLGVAVLIPLASFAAIFTFGHFLSEQKAEAQGGILATMAIVSSFLLSMASLVIWLSAYPPVVLGHHGDSHGAHGAVGAEGAADPHAKPPEGGTPTAAKPKDPHAHAPYNYISGEVYTLGTFGKLRIAISYYIDALTVVMFCMVTLIASCIHFYAQGYMHDELHEVVDHEVPVEPKPAGHGHDSHGHGHGGHGSHGHDSHAAAHGHEEHGHDAHADDHGHGHGPDDEGFLHRPGRFHRFFQYLSLFCFSMLGLLFAGNIAMVFIFWELVGVCSYFLIGFYVERQSASTAANKAFIVNRIGDFGMIIGLMALWAGVGTFAFGDIDYDASGKVETAERGLFTQVRPPEKHHELTVPEGMARWLDHELQAAQESLRAKLKAESRSEEEIYRAIVALTDSIQAEREAWHDHGYWLLIIAGVGIFCGCVGKSAQFPLHTWLPDAMEGPTPVSALVHSATMVAAGVYLVARFYPVFAPEVLLVISVTGAITLFIAATIAIVATDIKRVLAYSTISQLGYMMLALGLGGWLAGVMHLITHAFFKSLLFLCSGSVIHAVHTNDMTHMGGLRQKMPITAWTMLIGCLAIAGAGIPFLIGFSGYYSKDAILEQSLSFWRNSSAQWNQILGAIFFVALAGGAAITAFYMFRLWFLTFEGDPRDQARFDHAHESPAVMWVPLVVLAIFAVSVAWPISDWSFGYVTWDLKSILESGRPVGTEATQAAALVNMTWPGEHLSHADGIVFWATVIAFSTALGGILLSAAFYWWKTADPEEVRAAFPGIYKFLWNKWYFDELYELVFVQPVFFLAHVASAIDRNIIDAWIVDFSARVTRSFALVWEFVADQIVVDGLANGIAGSFYSLGNALREVQTGSVRQYVLFIVVGTVGLFILISFFWSLSLAG